MMGMKPRRVTSYTMILKEKLRRRRMEEKMSAKRKAEAPLSECTGEEEPRKVARLTNDDEEEEEEDTKDQRIRLVELGSDPMKGWTVCEEGNDDMMEKLDRSQSEDALECVPCNGDEGTSSEDTLDENDDNGDDTQTCTKIASAGGGTSSVAGTSKGEHAERRYWTPKEDAILVQWVTQNEGKKGVWARLVREKLPHRTQQMCRARWYYSLKPGIKKGPFSAEENKTLMEAYKKLGKKWTEISKRLPGRTAEAVRNRWESIEAGRKDKRYNWTAEEDAALVEWVELNGAKDFSSAAEKLPQRNADQCWQRWHFHLDPAGNPSAAGTHTKRCGWTAEEDAVILEWIDQNGEFERGDFVRIAKKLPHRTNQHCRQRWHWILNPAIKKEPWSEKEDKMLIEAHKQLGNKWAAIRKHLPGRTDRAIRHRWNSKFFQRKYFSN